MTDLPTLDRAFQFVMRILVETGRAPHYTELAAELRLSVEQGRQAVHELMDSGYPAWVVPGTDWIASFCPFSSIPTQYHITVEGQQKWFGQ
ncbi:MAG: hypothetical protein ACE5Q6_11715 [Dehalococcoidia bacterium]